MTEVKDGKTALYIGRFQPFHKGHLDVVKFIAGTEDISKIIIAIGSSQFDYMHKSPKWPRANNPFTYEERKEIIEKCIAGEIQKPYEIHALPDYFDYPKWYQHIVDKLPKFDCLYTTDRTEKAFFEGKSYEVRGFPLKYNYHAQLLRERMFKGQEYRQDLPAGTLEVFDRIEGEKRVKELFALDLADRLRQMK
jgi:nicotinamide-nucleotide adenylyltransferase